jgi:hypothetical protein
MNPPNNSGANSPFDDLNALFDVPAQNEFNFQTQPQQMNPFQMQQMIQQQHMIAQAQQRMGNHVALPNPLGFRNLAQAQGMPMAGFNQPVDQNISQFMSGLSQQKQTLFYELVGQLKNGFLIPPLISRTCYSTRF